jgi:hypothetical protein
VSVRLRRKTRPQADVEIYGGPLKQKRFDGGMNIDVPASEIKENEVAYASNVIFREFGFEARPGTIEISEFGFTGITPSSLYDYTSKVIKFGIFSSNYANIVSYNSTIRFYTENPDTAINSYGFDWSSGSGISASAWNPGTGDTTMVPYRRGFIIFNSAKISYCEASGSFRQLFRGIQVSLSRHSLAIFRLRIGWDGQYLYRYGPQHGRSRASSRKRK